MEVSMVAYILHSGVRSEVLSPAVRSWLFIPPRLGVLDVPRSAAGADEALSLSDFKKHIVTLLNL